VICKEKSFEDKEYFLQRSIVKVTDLREGGDVRGSPLIAEVILGNRRIHSVYNVMRTHLCKQLQVRSHGKSYSGISCHMREDCREPRLATVVATIEPDRDVHVHQRG